jgi:homoserine dehydrogenase
MSLENMSFEAALKEAQKKGFAEADPTLDIDGIDAAHKALILCNLAFQVDVNFKDVAVSGIRNFDLSDIRYAREFGYVIKLLAVSRIVKEGRIVTYVEPALIPFKHMLASVNYEFNAIYIDGEAVGETVFYGKGAGEFPTANSVLSDVIDLARHIVSGTKIWHYRNLKKPESGINRDIMNEYYLRFMTADKPGVLGRIAGILGRHNISISSCVQKEMHVKTVPVVMTTHFCRREDLEAAVAAIRKNVREVKAPIVALNIR